MGAGGGSGSTHSPGGCEGWKAGEKTKGNQEYRDHQWKKGGRVKQNIQVSIVFLLYTLYIICKYYFVAILYLG